MKVKTVPMESPRNWTWGLSAADAPDGCPWAPPAGTSRPRVRTPRASQRTDGCCDLCMCPRCIQNVRTRRTARATALPPDQAKSLECSLGER